MIAAFFSRCSPTCSGAELLNHSISTVSSVPNGEACLQEAANMSRAVHTMATIGEETDANVVTHEPESRRTCGAPRASESGSDSAPGLCDGTTGKESAILPSSGGSW